MNSRFEGDEGAVVWEDLMLDVKAGVELLKREPGITTVVLFAHSGGGSIMACYQALAENGPAFSQGENKISQGTDRLANLPRADAVIFADAHLGIAINTLRNLNAAVTDEKKTWRDRSATGSVESGRTAARRGRRDRMGRRF